MSQCLVPYEHATAALAAAFTPVTAEPAAPAPTVITTAVAPAPTLTTTATLVAAAQLDPAISSNAGPTTQRSMDSGSDVIALATTGAGVDTACIASASVTGTTGKAAVFASDILAPIVIAPAPLIEIAHVVARAIDATSAPATTSCGTQRRR